MIAISSLVLNVFKRACLVCDQNLLWKKIWYTKIDKKFMDLTSQIREIESINPTQTISVVITILTSSPGAFSKRIVSCAQTGTVLTCAY
jgi:hypothetical protein